MRPRKTSKIWSLVFVTTAICTFSCAQDYQAWEWAGSVQDSAGIRVVHNPEQGLWCPGQEWTLTDAMTIGADVGDPIYEFGKITDVQVGSGGLIFVFDQMASEIRVFEYAFTRMDLSPSAVERQIDRLSYGSTFPAFNRIMEGPEGEFLGSTAASYSSGFPVRWDGDGGGGVIVQRRAMGFNEDPDLEAGDPLVRIDRDGPEETIVIMPKAETVWMEGAAARFRYFATEPSWDLGPSGTLRTAMTQHYRIDLRGPDDSVHTVISKSSPPRPVTDQDKALFQDLMRDALTRMDLSPSAVKRQIDNLSYGSAFPAFNRIMEGPEGTTLVQRIDELRAIETLDLSEEMSRRLGSRTWDVFGPEGRFLGTIDLPARFSPMVWRPAAVYGRWLDDLDRPHMRKLHLVRSDQPPGEGCR
jgi:hypothetical protein